MRRCIPALIAVVALALPSVADAKWLSWPRAQRAADRYERWLGGGDPYRIVKARRATSTVIHVRVRLALCEIDWGDGQGYSSADDESTWAEYPVTVKQRHGHVWVYDPIAHSWWSRGQWR